jgi:hypothetical protein
MESFTQILEVAKNLGAPGVAIVSGALIIIWLARQAISMKRDLDKNKVESANELIKLWAELEGKKPNAQDPKFEAMREQILKRFGVVTEDLKGSLELKEDRDPYIHKYDDFDEDIKTSTLFAYAFVGSVLGAMTALAPRVAPILAAKGFTVGDTLGLVLVLGSYAVLGFIISAAVLGGRHYSKKTYFSVAFVATVIGVSTFGLVASFSASPNERQPLKKLGELQSIHHASSIRSALPCGQCTAG